jgi:hypothetical protein
MKKSFLPTIIGMCLIIAVVSPVNAAKAQKAPGSVQQTENSVTSANNNNFYNMGRGVVNLTTCWLEVFRCMVYRNSEVPFWGFIGGAVEGTGLTGMRAFGGVTDVMFLGFDIGSIYNDQFQDFVWSSKWVPKSSLQDARKAAGQ